ncbi:hypothetical protein L2E82_35616 [Cichorium intybus]|uniref:Uncharacterized protein n=1 Tax=Cichorium intybus TaxID=13427 RepID=A0ACB9BPC4_CICIN|nr:hypothetical protein L2E82_35616 [Cichorium intybus]
MKEQEEKITIAAVIRKKIDKKKMRSDVTLKKKKKITKKKSDVQQLEGDFYKNDNVNEDWMDSGPSVPRFDIILDGSKSIEEFKEKIDFLFKSFCYLKPTIDDWIKRAWSQFPGNKEILKYADKRNSEFNKGNTMYE